MAPNLTKIPFDSSIRSFISSDICFKLLCVQYEFVRKRFLNIYGVYVGLYEVLSVFISEIKHVLRALIAW